MLIHSSEFVICGAVVVVGFGDAHDGLSWRGVAAGAVGVKVVKK